MKAGRERTVLSEIGDAVGIYNRIYLLPCFAKRALMGRFAVIVIQNAIRGKYCFYRETKAFLGGCENRADTGDLTAVVPDCLNSALYGITGGNGCRKDENMLALDHRNRIVTE